MWTFGPFTVDAREGRLTRDGKPIAISPKPFEALVLLLTRRPRLVTRQELLDALWPDTFVVRLDPTYAEAHFGLALYHGIGAAMGLLPPVEGWRAFQVSLAAPHASTTRSAKTSTASPPCICICTGTGRQLRTPSLRR